MKQFNYMLKLFIICIFILGCGGDDEKWKAVPLKINKQESYNYSEMISGKLDSIKKEELEEVRKVVSKEKENKQNLMVRDFTKKKNTKKNILTTILDKIKNIFD